MSRPCLKRPPVCRAELNNERLYLDARHDALSIFGILLGELVVFF